MHVEGYAAPETKAAVEQARVFIERSKELGESPNDPLLLFSVLYGVWAVNALAFNGDTLRNLAAQFLALAEKQAATAPLLIAHRIMGVSLLYAGDFANARMHLEQAIALYDPAEHRPLATRFGQDAAVHALSYRSLALWSLGYPEAAKVDIDQAISDAREIGQAATLMTALNNTGVTLICYRNYAAANAELGELVALAGEKGALYWKVCGMASQGCLFAQTGKTSDAVRMLTCGITAYRSTGATLWAPFHLSNLATSYASLGQLEDAWRCVGEAMRAVATTKEKWFEAEVHRIAGEIELSPERDAAKAEAYFERALAVARRQQAKSFELRAAMSIARLWRDQGKPQQARELLAPVYGWFTEGFDTRDLKEAKELLHALA
jgi:predicted ATPase